MKMKKRVELKGILTMKKKKALKLLQLKKRNCKAKSITFLILIIICK